MNSLQVRVLHLVVNVLNSSGVLLTAGSLDEALTCVVDSFSRYSQNSYQCDAAQETLLVLEPHGGLWDGWMHLRCTPSLMSMRSVGPSWSHEAAWMYWVGL